MNAAVNPPPADLIGDVPVRFGRAHRCQPRLERILAAPKFRLSLAEHQRLGNVRLVSKSLWR